MCDSRRPLNGADSHTPECYANGYGVDYGCTCPTYPIWPTRAANDGWDTPEVPPSARALVGAGARGGE